MNAKHVFYIGFCLLSFAAFAQEKPIEPNLSSAYPIYEDDIQYRSQLIRRMDLNEKINKPFFANGHWLSKFLIDGVKAGVLTPYKDDSLRTKLSKEEFLKNIKRKGKVDNGGLTADEIAAGFGGEVKGAKSDVTNGDDDGWGSSKKTDLSNAEKKKVDDFDAMPVVEEESEYRPKEMTLLDIKEFAIIDRKRSRLYFDIQAFTLRLSPSVSVDGTADFIASFRYKDVYDFFKNHPNDCIWFNPNNEMQHRNLADAFDLRLFGAYIIKKGNGADEYILDEKGMTAQKALAKSLKLEQQLQDKEAEMWEN